MKISATEQDEAALRTAKSRIESALSALDKAEAEAASIASKAAQLEGEVNTALAGLDPGDAEAVDRLASRQARLGVFKAWLAAGAPVVRASDDLAHNLTSAKPAIVTAAQSRHAEETTAAACYWSTQLAGLFLLDRAEKSRRLKGFANSVLADLALLLSARLPLRLTSAEVRDGVLDFGPGRAKRALTLQERQQGWVNE